MSKRIPAFVMLLGIIEYCFTEMVEGVCEIDPLRDRVEFALILFSSVEDTTTDLMVVLIGLESLRAFAKKYNFDYYENKLSELIEVFQENYLIAEAVKKRKNEEAEKT